MFTVLKLLFSFIKCLVEILTTMQILALFNIRAIELQALFKAIRSPWGMEYWIILNEIVSKMVLPKEGPDVFFDFTGKSSGVSYYMI
jgi:hypothetical protein